MIVEPSLCRVHDPVLRDGRRWECSRCRVPAQPGWVYAFEGSAGRTIYTKIGRATSVEDRLQGVQGSCPFRLYIAAAQRVPDCIAVEQRLHETFAKWREIGEWFLLPEKERRRLYRELGGLRAALADEETPPVWSAA